MLSNEPFNQSISWTVFCNNPSTPYLEKFEPHSLPRLAGYEENPRKRALLFTLSLAVGAIASAGTILIVFASTGAGL